jgi:hypothetical protein
MKSRMRYEDRGADGQDPVQVPHWKHMWETVRLRSLTFLEKSGLLSVR